MSEPPDRSGGPTPPRLTERAMAGAIDAILGERAVGAFRREVCRDARGTVLELGFGSGANLPHFPEAVTEVLAVDPSTAAWERARSRIDGFGRPVRRVGLDAAELPLAAASVDTVVCTWTLCSLPEVDRSLAEAQRVLRPGGAFHFVEHGLSPEPLVASVQHRLQPAWGRVSGGCHLDRDPVADLARTGWRVTDARRRYLAGWFWPARPWSWFTVGRAVPGPVD